MKVHAPLRGDGAGSGHQVQLGTIGEALAENVQEQVATLALEVATDEEDPGKRGVLLARPGAPETGVDTGR